MATVSLPTTSQLRAVAADRGISWLTEGFGYFSKDALAWIGVTILLFVITVVLTFVPFIGSLAVQLLTPVFIAGIMLGCKAREQGGEFTVTHLFAGFGEQTGQLVVLGLLYLAGIIALTVLVVIMVVFGAGGIGLLEKLETGDVSTLTNNLQFVLLVVLVIMALYIPLLMAIWFAPALVVLRNASAVDAMKLSFHGCLLNIIPFLLYGLVGLVLSIIAMIPMGLGLLVLLPVVMASIYAGYRDIYPEQ